MPTALITTHLSRIQLESERLHVRIPSPEGDADAGEVLREIPLRDLDRVVLGAGVSVTSPALTEMLRRHIPVTWLDGRGHFLGSFLPPSPAHGASRLRQYQRSLDDAFALDVAGRLVVAKLYNQRRVLQRIAAGRRRHLRQRAEWETADGELHLKPGEATEPGSTPDDPAISRAEEAIRWLDGGFAGLSRAASIDEVRGHEGAASARYFQSWAAFLPGEFPFVRRSTRPPHNPVNACISFGASFLYHEMTAAIHSHGLDPALGFLHTTENGRWSLALDLMEPFRPALVEALALDLFTHRIVSQADFEARDGGVFLADTGRRKFFVQYERRMERQFMSEAAGHRTTLRQQLDRQVSMLKAALDDPSKFEPFLIN